MSDNLHIAFELWLNDKGLSGLDAGVRSQLATKLSELGVVKPSDLWLMDRSDREKLVAIYPALTTEITTEKLRMDCRKYDQVHELPVAFVSWLKREINYDLGVSMRVELAEILFTLGAEEPVDLNGLEEEDIVDLRALIEKMGNNNKTKFNALF